jgi:hypothetical protein
MVQLEKVLSKRSFAICHELIIVLTNALGASDYEPPMHLKRARVLAWKAVAWDSLAGKTDKY